MTGKKEVGCFQRCTLLLNLSGSFYLSTTSLTDAYDKIHMGVCAEETGKNYNFFHSGILLEIRGSCDNDC